MVSGNNDTMRLNHQGLGAAGGKTGRAYFHYVQCQYLLQHWASLTWPVFRVEHQFKGWG